MRRICVCPSIRGRRLFRFPPAHHGRDVCVSGSPPGTIECHDVWGVFRVSRIESARFGGDRYVVECRTMRLARTTSARPDSPYNTSLDAQTLRGFVGGVGK